MDNDFIRIIHTYQFNILFACLKLTCPPIESPVTPNGPYPKRSHQCNRAMHSRIKHPPITKMSETWNKHERTCSIGLRYP